MWKLIGTPIRSRSRLTRARFAPFNCAWCRSRRISRHSRYRLGRAKRLERILQHPVKLFPERGRRGSIRHADRGNVLSRTCEHFVSLDTSIGEATRVHGTRPTRRIELRSVPFLRRTSGNTNSWRVAQRNDKSL